MAVQVMTLVGAEGQDQLSVLVSLGKGERGHSYNNG